MSSNVSTSAGSRPAYGDGPRTATQERKPTSRWFSPSNVGAVYVWILIVVVFALITPQNFLSADTAKTILNQHAITAIIALSLIVPMSTGVFDLSVAHTAGFANIMAAYLIVNADLHPALAVVVVLLLSLLIGVINGVVVVVFRIHSFIGTLATGSLITALILMVSNGRNISGAEILGGFSSLARSNIAGITLPVVIALAVATVLWYLHQHTVVGRYLYATGFGREAARLSGVKVEKLRFISLLVSSFIAGIAGILLAARIGSGSPTIGDPYLLPAFAGAFVGATQLKAGRFNAWGTVIAVMMLGTGIEGIGLAGGPIWASDVFVGVALIVALGLTGLGRRTTYLSGQ